MLFQSHRMWAHHNIAGVALISPEELGFIAKQIPEEADEQYHVVEIGTHCGASAAWIMDQRPRIQWTAVDIFRYEETYGVLSFVANRARHDRLNCFIGTAEQWYDLYGEGLQVALVIVDGEHTYEACRADLDIAVRVTDTIVAHDYGLACFPGVTQAIDETEGWQIVDRHNLTVVMKRAN